MVPPRPQLSSRLSKAGRDTQRPHLLSVHSTMNLSVASTLAASDVGQSTEAVPRPGCAREANGKSDLMPRPSLPLRLKYYWSIEGDRIQKYAWRTSGAHQHSIIPSLYKYSHCDRFPRSRLCRMRSCSEALFRRVECSWPGQLSSAASSACFCCLRQVLVGQRQGSAWQPPRVAPYPLHPKKTPSARP